MRSLSALILIAAAGACGAAAPGATATTHTSHCRLAIVPTPPSFGVAIEQLKAAHATCATAKRVARAYVRQHLPAGWTCAPTRTGTRCARTTHVVTFHLESTS